jgi:hypothetical protein
LLCDFVSSLAAGSNRDLLAVHTHRHGRTLAMTAGGRNNPQVFASHERTEAG